VHPRPDPLPFVTVTSVSASVSADLEGGEVGETRDERVIMLRPDAPPVADDGRRIRIALQDEGSNMQERGSMVLILKPVLDGLHRGAEHALGGPVIGDGNP